MTSCTGGFDLLSVFSEGTGMKREVKKRDPISGTVVQITVQFVPTLESVKLFDVTREPFLWVATGCFSDKERSCERRVVQ